MAERRLEGRRHVSEQHAAVAWNIEGGKQWQSIK